MALGRAMGERVMPNDVILLTGDLVLVKHSSRADSVKP